NHRERLVRQPPALYSRGVLQNDRQDRDPNSGRRRSGSLKQTSFIIHYLDWQPAGGCGHFATTRSKGGPNTTPFGKQSFLVTAPEKSTSRQRGLPGTEIHFHFLPVITVK